MTLPIIGKHLIYEFETIGRYEAYYQTEDRIVYKIHGGPMKGRQAYQRAHYQRVDEDIYMISWIEETGTTVTTCVNLKEKTVNGFIAFAAGHFRNPNGAALGDKRDPETLDRWRELAKIGNTTTDRVPKPVKAKIVEIFDGPGDLVPITPDMPLF